MKIGMLFLAFATTYLWLTQVGFFLPSPSQSTQFQGIARHLCTGDKLLQERRRQEEMEQAVKRQRELIAPVSTTLDASQPLSPVPASVPAANNDAAVEAAEPVRVGQE